MRSPRLPAAARGLPLAGLLIALALGPASAAEASRFAPRSPGPWPAMFDTSTDGFLKIDQVVVGKPACDTCPPRACPEESTRVSVTAGFGNLCGWFKDLRVLPPPADTSAPFTVVLADLIAEDCGGGCPDMVYTAQRSTALPPPLTPGLHSFLLVEQVRSCRDTTIILSSRQQMITYEVLPRCGPVFVPIDSLARRLVGLGVAPERRCAGDSLSLLLFKNGCPPCTDLTGLTLEPGIGFHATLDWRPGCLELACFPETLSTPLGRFAAGHHTLDGRVDVRLLLEPPVDSTISYFTRVEFDVPQTCDTTEAPCMSPYLVAGAVRSAGCALTLDAGSIDGLTLSAYPTEPLGGLQGRIDCSPPFRIVRAGAPEGMSHLHVSWTPEGRGIRYLIFADPGFPIDFPKGPVMRLQIAADRDAPPGARGSLLPFITLAADTKGDSVQLCDPRLRDAPRIELCVSDHPSVCDVNFDGRLDVRDLVQLVGCLSLPVPADVDTGVCVDCNGDGGFGLPDVFCCAREILRGPLVPRDSVNVDDSLRVSLGPVWSAGDMRIVHVRVAGARRLGATSIRLDYPAERWRANLRIHLDRPEQPADVDWYPLIDVDEPGHVYLGGLRLGDSGGEDQFEFEILMEPTAPALPGDRLEAVGADFGARDGSVLVPSAALPVLSLTAPAAPEPVPGQGTQALALSPARPNPFNTSTRFVVTLPSTSQIGLAVHDLAGRRVATLASGLYPAGQREFTWDGAGAHDGLYFVQLTVDGQVRSTRVALLRDSR